MKRGSGVSQRVILAGWLLLGIGLLIGTAEAQQTETVECAEGETIAEALTEAEPGEPLLVVVQGTCNENVTITPDDVTLQGDPATGGTVNGLDPNQSTVLIRGARRVGIDNLTVSGAKDGVTGLQGASFTIDQSQITNNARHGIRIADNSSGVITNSLIQGNGGRGVSVSDGSSARIGLTDANLPGPNTIDSNGLDGISVTMGAFASIFGNTISSNGLGTNRNGIGIFRAGAVLLGQNTIENNGAFGIALNQAALDIAQFGPTAMADDIIRGNTRSGIGAFLGVFLDIEDATITNNGQDGITLGDHSALRIRRSTVSDNTRHGIFLFRDSGVNLTTPAATVTGNGQFGLLCGDIESSRRGNTSGVMGNVLGQVRCTGF